MPGDPGLFGPGTAAWRLGRERLLLAGGPAALLLQVAHPLVAAGVAEHSEFTQDPLHRLRGTLEATLTVTFGDTAQVQSVARAVARRHAPVRGRLAAGTGRFPAGTEYDARDPELAMWVFATLVWTAVTVAEVLLPPASRPDRNGYYTDMRQFGARFGAEQSVMPADYAALDGYVQQMARDVLFVDPVARRLARQVLAPDPPVLPAPLRPLAPLLAAALLPGRVREMYELPWRRSERLAWAGVRQAVRRGTPALPAGLRYWPHYSAAVARMHGADSA